MQAEISDAEKARLYEEIGVRQRNSKPGHALRPRWVPAKVRVLICVHSEIPFSRAYVEPGEYGCECNPLGAVSVRTVTGSLLGMMPDEIEILEWKENPAYQEESEWVNDRKFHG